MARTRRQNKLAQRPLARRRRGGRRRRRGGRRRSAGMHYVETIPISIDLGTSAFITVRHLENRPKACCFRVQYVHFVGTMAYDLNSPGAMSPSAVQVDIIDFNSGTNSDIVATSGPVVLGVSPKNVKVHQPRQSDWMPATVAETVNVAKISASCIGSPLAPSSKDKWYLRGICHVLVRFGPELVASACPANTLDSFMKARLLTNHSEPNLDFEYCKIDTP